MKYFTDELVNISCMLIFEAEPLVLLEIYYEHELLELLEGITYCHI